MGKVIDITNQKFGKITALYDTGIRKNRQALWHCKCDCGNECDILGSSLRSGHTTSCGCKGYESKAENLIGQKFNQLTVLEREGSDERRHALWKCRCDCGNFRTLTTSELKSGTAKACRECSFKNSHQGHEHVPVDYTKTIWYNEIVGKKFGKLLAIKPTDKRDNAGRMIWECKCDCGNPNPIFVSSSALKSGNTQSCGCLKHTSIGEEIIANLLIENNINFKRQFTFPDLFSPKGSLLRFDFGVYNEQGVLKYLIEYDGIQHYMPVEYFGGEKAFKYLQECDKLKEEYCKDWNFPLIRISYLNENITLKDILL